VAQVPLADDRSLVARLLERLWQQPLVRCQAKGVAGWDDRGLQPIAERVASRHQRGARRRAHRLGIELLEARAGPGELVDIWCLDVGAVEADILPAEIVGHDVDDVRFRALGRGGRDEPAERERNESDRGRLECGKLHCGAVTFMTGLDYRL
jgi:hypothetical protein